ncbi:alr0857 family protein [Leptolyngbya sp. AN02str]|uniref:alr0857 family protein n=1 Tax=Leptolyngbya sp. AN02str TaxID=3423363 RepID=UPI003D317757
MLKLNYTDVGLYMEQTMTHPELLIAQRVLLAMRLGQMLHVEPGRASFLLPADLPELEELEAALQREYNPNSTILLVDDASVEVNLSGCWMAESKEAQEGMFLALMSDSLSETLRERIERFIYKLWQMSEVHISSPA